VRTSNLAGSRLFFGKLLECDLSFMYIIDHR
jgi:hypothetical protein